MPSPPDAEDADLNVEVAATFAERRGQLTGPEMAACAVEIAILPRQSADVLVFPLERRDRACGKQKTLGDWS